MNRLLCKGLKILLTTICGCVFFACEDGFTPVRFVQISDPQLGMGGYAHDSAALAKAVAMVNEISPAFVVVSGDLVHDVTAKSVADVKMLFSQIKSSLCLVPGNHDVGNTPTDSTLTIYRSVFGDDYYSFDSQDLRVVVVNTLLWKTQLKAETEKMQKWFENQLKKASEDGCYTIVVGHHPIFMNSIDEAEDYHNIPPGLRTRLLDMMQTNNVKAYLSGHLHKKIVGEYKGIKLLSCEALSTNFDQDKVGFRIWNIDSNGIDSEFIPVDPIE